MSTTINQIRISSILENDAALTPSAGDKVYSYISQPLKKNEPVLIDFEGIKFITSAFLNASIGQLYAHYTSDFVKQHVQVTHLDNDDLILLARVIERAKEYFSNKANIEAALGNILKD